MIEIGQLSGQRYDLDVDPVIWNLPPKTVERDNHTVHLQVQTPKPKPKPRKMARTLNPQASEFVFYDTPPQTLTSSGNSQLTMSSTPNGNMVAVAPLLNAGANVRGESMTLEVAGTQTSEVGFAADNMGQLALAIAHIETSKADSGTIEMSHATVDIAPIEPFEVAEAMANSEVAVHISKQRSQQLNLLTCGPYQRPTSDMALSAEYFPFVEGARQAQPAFDVGVIQLSNVSRSTPRAPSFLLVGVLADPPSQFPIATSRNEILAILGVNAKVLNDRDEPVHTIIERINAMTTCAFIEFTTLRAAELVIEKFQRNQRDGRPPKLGEVPVDYRLSSQAELMAALFPSAKGVYWDGPVPIAIPDAQMSQDQPWLFFRGIVNVEEMQVLAKHAELAHVSPTPSLPARHMLIKPFSQSANLMYCPQRPYECMMSILLKMPWYATDLITVIQRHAMYTAVMRMIKALQKKIYEKAYSCPVQLNRPLLDRLVRAAINCHGFSVIQKDSIAYHGNVPADRMSDFNMPRFSKLWIHTRSMVPKPGVPTDLLEVSCPPP